MSPKLTYPDSGVLIAGSRGESHLSERALRLLDDPEREFAASTFLRLEVIPKATFHKQTEEVAYYESFFAAVTKWSAITDRLMQEAFDICATYGLNAVDGLHVASAVSVGAEELITTERLEKPIYRVAGIKVVSLLAVPIS